MASNLTFVPVALFDSRVVDFVDSAKALARSLRENNLPSMLIERDPGDDLDRCNKISDAILKHEILPVIRFYTTDESPQLRNLHESAVLGTLDLVWQDGEPVFEMANLLEFLLETWKTRMPIDINIFFRGKLPKHVAIQNIARMVKSVMERNRHVQVVKLSELPEGLSGEENEIEARKLLDLMIESCPGSESALSPDLWASSGKLREGIYDLGLVEYECIEPCADSYKVNSVRNAESVAAKSGIPLLPRLPLTVTFYRRSWFAIDVGKVLSRWADFKNYQLYMERPQADSRYTRQKLNQP